MNEKRGNIESWLKTAAQQPGPGLDRKDEEEGWAGLSAMLDDDKKRPGIIAGAAGLRLRRNRWLLLTAVALVASLLLLISLYRSNEVSRPPSNSALTTATPGKANNAARNNSGDGIAPQAPAPPSGRSTQDEEPAEQVAGATAGHVPALLPAGKTTGELARPHEKQAIHDQASLLPQKETNNVELIKANGLSLQTLPLPHGNGLSLSGTGMRLLPAPPSAAVLVRSPRWAIQAGFLATGDEGRGVRASFMYHLPFSKHFYLEPYIGAAYTGNYNKTLGHFGVQPVQDGSTGQYRTDSVWTTYRVKNVLSADAGIRIGYTLNQFSFGTGLRYHNILYSKGDSSSIKKWGGAPSGSQPSQAFSKADAPGKHSFYWELETAYQWRSGLQTGISYQLLLDQSASPAWQLPVYDPSGSNSSVTPGADFPAVKNSLQDKGRLEIYLRLPLGKK